MRDLCAITLSVSSLVSYEHHNLVNYIIITNQIDNFIFLLDIMSWIYDTVLVNKSKSERR